MESSGSDEIKRFYGSTGAFFDNFASGNGLLPPTFFVVTPEPSALWLPTVGLAALAWRQSRG